MESRLRFFNGISRRFPAFIEYVVQTRKKRRLNVEQAGESLSGGVAEASPGLGEV
jgi:hypothetical protein